MRCRFGRLNFGVQPAKRKRAIEANKIHGMKGTKLLEARIKAEEWQKVKNFMPNANDGAASIEAEDDKVCDTLLLLSYQT